MTRGLSLVLLLHAIVTFLAGVVLVVAPRSIPRAAGIDLAPAAALVAYLLAACELGFAVLSYVARSVTDPRGLRAILISIVVMHVSSVALELMTMATGIHPVIAGNVLLRILVIAVFLYFLRRLRTVHA